MSKDFVVPTREGTVLKVRVSPGARRTSLEGLYGGSTLKLRIAAPPVDGKANAEAVRFLAQMLGVARSHVAVIRGASSRDKVLLVRGTEAGEVRGLLSERLP